MESSDKIINSKIVFPNFNSIEEMYDALATEYDLKMIYVTGADETLGKLIGLSTLLPDVYYQRRFCRFILSDVDALLSKRGLHEKYKNIMRNLNLQWDIACPLADIMPQQGMAIKGFGWIERVLLLIIYKENLATIKASHIEIGKGLPSMEKHEDLQDNDAYRM